MLNFLSLILSLASFAEMGGTRNGGLEDVLLPAGEYPCYVNGEAFMGVCSDTENGCLYNDVCDLHPKQKKPNGVTSGLKRIEPKGSNEIKAFDSNQLPATPVDF